MRVYYFIHLTGQDPGNTGIQRVVRNLGAALQSRSDIDLIPVRWSATRKAIVHAERSFKDIIRLFGGPRFQPHPDEGLPIASTDPTSLKTAWIIIPEVPHLSSHNKEFPSVQAFNLFGYARKMSLRTAVVFHDLLPLTHSLVNGSADAEQLDFTIYGQSLLNADILFPVSNTCGGLLKDWLRDAGARDESIPRFEPIFLPEEMIGVPRGAQGPRNSPADSAVEFVTYGTVCARKNQIKSMTAFNRLCRRRTDLNLIFNVIGHVHPEVASACARQVAQSAERIRVLGYQSDENVIGFIRRARATVFVSLAEGYGLPLAESLWLGCPCICSNIPPMSEVAAGGGCLLVDPTDLAEIERGMEQMACDKVVYKNVCNSLTHRDFRLWSDYANSVVSNLRIAQGGAAIKTEHPVANRATPARSPSRVFEIAASDLRAHDAFERAGKPLFTGGMISFDFKKHADVAESTLFYGPYISLKPGCYTFEFEGALLGSVKIRFLDDCGAVVLGERQLSDLRSAVILDLFEPAESFEILAEKTSETRSIDVRSIYVECFY